MVFMKAKKDIAEYCTASEATAILSSTHGRPVGVTYISKMAKSKKHRIRTELFGDRLMYHRMDVAQCRIGPL